MSIRKQRMNKIMNHGKIFPVAFMFLVCLLSENVVEAKAFDFTSPPDTAKTQYDINDPRNPNCPCHKQQQQADEEYEQMQQQQNPQLNPQVQVQVSVSNQAEADNTNNEDVESEKTDNGNDESSDITKSHRKEFSIKPIRKKLLKLSWRISKRKSGTKKFGSHLADCFHWG